MVAKIAPPGDRLVDSLTGGRTRPMKVLALGQARTGTSSLRDALELCGYKPYHFSSMMMDWEQQVPLWIEAVENKFSPNGRTWGREEFDKMIGNYDVVEDNPGIVFAEELIKAYPDAKVILTNRDVDAWVKSMQKTVLKNRHNLIFTYLAPLFPFAGSWWKINNLIIDNVYAGGADPQEIRQSYIDHYARVRALVPKDNLLELHFGDGWEPVCKFLDIPVPDVPWPHANEGGGFVAKNEFFSSRIAMFCGAFALIVGLISWRLPIAYARYPAVRTGTQFFLVSIAGGVFWNWAANAFLRARKDYFTAKTVEYSG